MISEWWWTEKNLVGSGRGWPNFKVLSLYLPGGTEENHNKPQDSQSQGPRIEPGTSRIRSKSVNHSTVTFSGCFEDGNCSVCQNGHSQYLIWPKPKSWSFTLSSSHENLRTRIAYWVAQWVNMFYLYKMKCWHISYSKGCGAGHIFVTCMFWYVYCSWHYLLYYRCCMCKTLNDSFPPLCYKIATWWNRLLTCQHDFSFLELYCIITYHFQ
jgi:hypothetical protein